MTPADPTNGFHTGPTERLVVLCADDVCEHDPKHIPLPVLFLGDSTGSVVTRWVLTDEERAAVAAGADLWIHQEGIAGNGFPPILPTFETPRVGEMCCPDCCHLADHTAGEARNRCPFCSCTTPFLMATQ